MQKRILSCFTLLIAIFPIFAYAWSMCALVENGTQLLEAFWPDDTPSGHISSGYVCTDKKSGDMSINFQSDASHCFTCQGHYDYTTDSKPDGTHPWVETYINQNTASCIYYHWINNGWSAVNWAVSGPGTCENID